MFKQPIRTDRRRFLMGGAALGLSAATPVALLSACGGSDDDPPPADAQAREAHHLHFDLSRDQIAEPRLFALRSAHHGRGLLAHDGASRAKHRALDPTLQDVDDARLTHYLEDVDLPGNALQAVLVYGKHPTSAAAMLAGAHIHVPNSARRSVALRAAGRQAQAGLSAKRMAYGIRERALGADAPADNIDNYSTPWDVAKFLVFHHPEVMNLNADLGAEILSRIDTLPCSAADIDSGACAPLLSPLAFQIATAIENNGYPTTTPGSWATLVPMTKSDGTPVIGTNGQQTYRFDITDETAKATGDVVKQLLKNIFDDTLFKGTNWHATPVAAKQTASSLRRSPTAAMRKVAAGAAATFDVEASTPVGSSLSGIRMVDLQVSDPATRQIQLTIKNDYLRYLGVFVQFRDGNTTNDADGELLAVTKANTLDTDRANWIALAASNSDIMGIPFQGDTVESRPITFTMPAAAASATVMFGSLGLGGDAFTGEAVAGSILTLGFNIGIPTLLLALGIGADIAIGIEVRSLAYQLANTTLQEIVISIVRGLVVSSPQLAAGITDQVGGNSCAGWVAGVANSIIQALLDYAPVLATMLVTSATADAIADALFPLSICCRVLAELASAAEIGVTVGEVLASPAISRNKISLKMDTTVRISRDPRDFQFPAAARSWVVNAYYDGGATPRQQGGTITQGTVDPIDAVFVGVPSGGMVRFDVLMYSDDGCLVGYAQSDSIVNMPDSAGLLQLQITELLASLKASTQYEHSLKLGYEGSTHAWSSGAAPTQTRTSLCQGTEAAVCELNGITVHTASGMVGYGYSGGVSLCGGGGSGIGHTVRNLFLGHDPDRAAKSLGCGYPQPVGIFYDASGPAVGGKHFFVRPDSDGYHLQFVTLDDTTPFSATDRLSWGRFNNALDSFAMLPSGYVIGVNRQTHKMESLLLGKTAVNQATEPTSVPFATLLSGQGTRPGLLDTPVAVASFGGAVLVLEQGNARVQALDPNGNPVNLFSNGTTNLMPLRAETGIVYLDVATEGQGYMYVLSYEGNGTVASQYRLDIYTPNGDFLCRTSGVSAGRMAVDLFRNVYTLNYETLVGATGVEPTLSQWLPHTPDACVTTLPPSSAATGKLASCRAPAMA